MRKILGIAFLILLLVCPIERSTALSLIFSLSEKLAAADFIARVQIADAQLSPNSKSEGEIHCRVVEQFKGPKTKELTFHTHAYGTLDPKEFATLPKKEFFIFLHRPHGNVRWLFQGPQGMLPIQDRYTEYRVGCYRNI